MRKQKKDLGVPTGTVPVFDKKKRLPLIDKNEQCAYCHSSYHPMPIYTLKKAVFGKKPQIFVCHSKEVTGAGGEKHWVETFDCRHKAVADGYEFRPDLGKG